MHRAAPVLTKGFRSDVHGHRQIHKRVPASALLDPEIVRRRSARLPQARPARHGPNPVMFVVEVGASSTTVLFVRDSSRGGASRRASTFQIVALALVHGAVRQLRRGDGRGARQGAGRRAAQDAHRDARPSCWPARDADRTSSSCPAPSLQGRRRRAGRGGRPRSRPTARSSRASPRSTSPRSPASPRRSSARRAATARRSPAAPGALRLDRGADHRRPRARPSSTA